MSQPLSFPISTSSGHTGIMADTACDQQQREGAQQQQGQDQVQPNLLVSLPGPAWAILWSCLRTSGDRLNLFRVCRGARDGVLDTASSLGLTITSASQGSLALLRAVLSRPHPLAKLRFAAAKGQEGTAGALLLKLLQEGAAASLTHGQGSGAWPAAAALKELHLQVIGSSQL